MGLRYFSVLYSHSHINDIEMPGSKRFILKGFEFSMKIVLTIVQQMASDSFNNLRAGSLNYFRRRPRLAGEKNGAEKSEPARKVLVFEFRPL